MTSNCLAILMIAISTEHLLALAETARADGRLQECREILLRIPKPPQGLFEDVTHELAKAEAAAGRYGSAQQLFAEVCGHHSNRFVRCLAQERAHLLSRITTRQQSAVTSSRELLDHVRLDRPARLPPESLRPEINFVGSPAAYRSAYDRRRSDSLSALIRQVKKGVDEPVITALGELLAVYVYYETDLLASVDYIVPVPTRPERASERGYSIPLLLAEEVSKRCAVPMHEEFLRTSGPNFELRNVPKWARAALTESGYELNKRPEWIGGTTALVIDDVITTGSTVRSVARLLAAAGATSVSAVALAHSEWSGYAWDDTGVSG